MAGALPSSGVTFAFSARYQSGEGEPVGHGRRVHTVTHYAAVGVGVHAGQQRPAGPGDASQLGQASRRVVEVVEHEGGQHVVDRAVAQRQPGDVADHR